MNLWRVLDVMQLVSSRDGTAPKCWTSTQQPALTSGEQSQQCKLTNGDVDIFVDKKSFVLMDRRQEPTKVYTNVMAAHTQISQAS